MDDEALVVMGRIAVGWGQIIFQLDQIVLGLTGFTLDRLRDYPTFSLKRKLGDLYRELSKPERADIRPHLRAVHTAVEGLASDRNVIFHGLWGWALDETEHDWKPISRSYTRDDPFALDDLTDFHERLIDASVIVSAAVWRLEVGASPAPEGRNLRQCWASGPPAEDAPPPPEVIAR